MHSDAYFAKGKLHKACEDYSLAGRVGDKPYGILADGCSSSPDTDIGARLLARSLFYEVAHNPIDLSDHAEFFDSRFAWCHGIRLESSLSRAHQVRRILGLPSNCLDATLLHVEVNGDHVHVAVRGDGYIVCRHRKDSQTRDIFQIEYPSGAPEYLNYHANSARYEQYRNEMGIKKHLNVWRSLSSNEMFREPDVSDVFEEATLYKEFPVELYDTVSLLSDGANTFFNHAREHLSHLLVIEELTAFKITAGCFVERRMKRFLKRCRKDLFDHDDDLSMVSLYLGD